ncbi:MAG TPA: zinc-dependent metalloprotease [Thermoleophilaceae bacterium]|nr:zinc-dependent metalloprotease [Thermoleophilaceae bacterium]
MVDWTLARQVARLAAGTVEPVGDEPDLDALCSEMEVHVAGYTRLLPATPVPRPEAVTRPEWTAVNLDALGRLLDPVAQRLDARLEFAGPLAGALRTGAAATLAAEAGLVLGYVSQRVLGQYEVSLLGGDAPPRLLFVAQNIRKAVREMDVAPAPFHRWICAHELTHVFQFQGVGWLRDHLSGMIRTYLKTVEVRIERGAAGGLPSVPSAAQLVEAWRSGGLAALVQTDEQRQLMDRMQAAMAVIEGYSEHAMDAIAAAAIPDHERLRAAMDARRRSRSAPERVIERLLGLNIKLQQYELGKAFCDAVAGKAGIEGLNRVWEAPEALPTLAELSRPEAWLERTGSRPKAA